MNQPDDGVAGAGASAAQLAELPDEALLEALQRQTFRLFWEGAHPVSALSPDRRSRLAPDTDLVAIGGSGFGIMALLVAVERGWVTRAAALERLERMLLVLTHARCYHGALPHFADGRTGEAIALINRKDDGADLVETSYLCMGLLCARQYFTADSPEERRLRARLTGFCEDVEWSWYTRGDRKVLYWHWSPNNGWAMDHEVRGWNECLVTYVLAAGAQRYPIDAATYHRGYAGGNAFFNGQHYYGIELPLGLPYGGPLFFAHYSFCGLDPRGLKDRYANYWEQNVRHVRINRAHCVANPHGHAGYGADCWGLTASDGPGGYAGHSPADDDGTIAPTAALASFPYTPRESMQVLRHFLRAHGAAIWDRFGFVDAFCEARNWVADTFLSIDQGPIILMVENYRTGLLWKLFMSAPEVQRGLRRLEFTSPHLAPAAP